MLVILALNTTSSTSKRGAMKRTLLIDLDGVLNTYNGQFDEYTIPPVKQGAYEFLQNLSDKFIIKIFTTRNKLLASKWIIDNKLDKFVSDVTNVKDPAWLIIDDRCLTFDGDYKNTLELVNNFSVWYHK